MLADGRHQAIIKTVKARGSITVRELAEEIGVAVVTVRNDVRELARRGTLLRVHGGVVWPPGPQATDQTVPEADGGRLSAGLTATGRSRKEAAEEYSLGMVVPHSSYYYPEVVSGARAAAEALGAKLTLGVSRNAFTEEHALVAQMLQTGVDGLLLTTAEDPRTSPATEDWLRGLPVPVVLVERRIGRNTGPVEHVATDHEWGAYLAVRHLAEQGRTRIALLQFDTLTAPMLQIGYQQAMTALDLRPCAPEVPCLLLEDDPADLDDKCERLVRAVKDGQVDAVLIHNDSIALPLVSRLQAAGIGIPGDLAVVTYDDELASLASPPLTSVAPPRRTVGAEAVELLVRRLQDPDRPAHHLTLHPKLNIRG
ncbi:DNA-binding LacI/PurR family transcriptional regulator [Actinocorallia herbida]|uniref:DNA-binding LacI/PurR family transcriptional regulator n=1 Tax=Actinocorallia herbida TaxID=58109 RepID=A0A3N1CV31_9ACTN|nr:substrate-binding domain-containing protein [Actinocorallia herbida]ROO85084.1 DNA-binding LacI/PurR family transcriptional regulator [Actinocorallia herbida]